MTMGDRIKQRLAELRISGAELARRVGVTQPTISDLINGKSRGTTHLHAIARELQTTSAFLLGETDHVADPGNMGERQMPFRHAPMEADPDMVEVAEFDLGYGLGGTFLDGPLEAEVRRFSRAWLRTITDTAPEHLVWTRGRGDSMKPTIQDGDPILIDRSKITPEMGDEIWACAYGDVGMIKRLRPLPNGTVEVHSDNEVVRPFIAADGELHVVGRVIARINRL